MINYIALLTALVISAVSGYFSVLGLVALFSGQFWSIVVMGTCLEIGKIVSAAWLNRNFKTVSWVLKSYLIGAIIILLCINSISVYGFLAKSHIDTTLTISTGVVDQIKTLDTKITIENEAIKDLDKQITLIDNALDSLVNQKAATAALNQAQTQKKNRDSLVTRRNERSETLIKLRQEKFQKESEVKKMEAEVGPLRYVADLFYGQADPNQLERAVRWLIIVLVSVFDPLAIVLLIAANRGLAKRKEENSKVHIDASEILKVN